MRLGPAGDPGPNSPVAPDAGSAAEKSTPQQSERKGVLVVSRKRRGPFEYASLAEACHAAKSGDVVELHITGGCRAVRSI